MDRLKTFRKYVLWVVGFYILSTILIYIGLNSRYKNMTYSGELPGNVVIKLAQSTKVNGKIFGEIKSTEDDILNGKYIKVDIYTSKFSHAGTKYIKIENTEVNVPKKFAVYFTAENIEYYTVEIMEDSEEMEQSRKKAIDLFGNEFTNEELKKYAIISLLLYWWIV